MTAEPAEVPVPAPLHAFTTATREKTTLVTLDGHPLTAYRPKTQWFIDKAAAWSRIPEDDPRNIEVLQETLEKLFPLEEDQAYLYGRLRDEDDDFDIEDLEAVFTWLRERWAGGRPTGSATGSASRSQKRGGRSTARRR